MPYEKKILPNCILTKKRCGSNNQINLGFCCLCLKFCCLTFTSLSFAKCKISFKCKSFNSTINNLCKHFYFVDIFNPKMLLTNIFPYVFFKYFF